MDDSKPEMQAWSGGLVFTGYFATEQEAWASVHELEQNLTLDRGFRHVRGGIKPMEKPLCDCDGPDDCDESAGCVFSSFRAED